MLCIARPIATVMLSFMFVTVPVAIAIPSGKLCRNIPQNKYSALFFSSFPCSCCSVAGWMCGISLSNMYIVIAPIVSPIIVISSDPCSIASGISSRKDIDNITAAANASMLYIVMFDGILIMPIALPITGLSIDNIITIISAGSIFFICGFLYVNS